MITLFVYDDENFTKPQTPAAASIPVQTLEEDKAVSSLKSPLGQKPCFRESITECLLKAASPACLEPGTVIQSQASGKSSSASRKSNIFDT